MRTKNETTIAATLVPVWGARSIEIVKPIRAKPQSSMRDLYASPRLDEKKDSIPGWITCDFRAREGGGNREKQTKQGA